MSRRPHILLITYYHPPCNGMPSARTAFWAEHLSTRHRVTVVTRGWKGDERVWPDYMASNDLDQPEVERTGDVTTYYLPYHKKIQPSSPMVRKARTMRNLLHGKLQTELDGFGQFRGFVYDLVLRDRPDLIIVSVPPLNLIRLGHEICEDHGIPWVCDFKDFENRIILSRKTLGLSRGTLVSRFRRNHVFHWLQNCAFFTSSTQAIVDYIEKACFMTGYEITNGFEKRMFDSLRSSGPNEAMTLTTLGTIYPEQDLTILSEGVQLFRKSHPQAKIRFRFIGTAAITEVKESIERLFREEEVEISDRMPRTEALQIGKDSDILFYPAWKNYTGIYSGKLFEYLGLRKFILIAPGDDDVIDRTLSRTRAGVSANTPREVADTLSSLYEQWGRCGQVHFNGWEEVIQEYSRTFQAQKLDVLLDELIGKAA